MAYTRTIKVTTSEDNQDLLTLPEVENALCETLKIDNHEEYEKIKRTGLNLGIDVFASDTRVAINGDSYNDLIENIVYSTDTIMRIYAIRIEDANTTVTLSLRIGS